jgi:hypothetical protein
LVPEYRSADIDNRGRVVFGGLGRWVSRVLCNRKFLHVGTGGIISLVASILNMRSMPNLGSSAFWAVGIIYCLSSGIWTICAVFWLHRHMRPQGTRAESVATQTMPGCGLFFYPLTPEANEPDCGECSVGGDCAVVLIIEPVMYTLLLATRTCESVLTDLCMVPTLKPA